MKSFMLITSVAMLMLTVAANADDTAHWNGPGMFVVLRHGDRAIDLRAGDNQLDEPKTIVCRSANGCLISLAAQVFVDHNSTVYVCSLVDRLPASPRCLSDGNSGYLPSRQSAHVSPGTHTVQTIVNSSADSGTVYTWEADYTVYEQ